MTILILISLFIGSLSISGIAIHILLKSSFVHLCIDAPDSRKVHKIPIPRLGGIAMVFSMLIFLVGSIVIDSVVSLYTTNIFPLLYSIIISSIIIMGVGFFDDTIFLNVRVRHKLIAEFCIACITVFVFGIYIGRIDVFGLVTLPKWVGMGVSFFWIIGLANAYNIVDGIDGLTGSLALLAFLTVGAIALITNVYSISMGVIIVIMSGVVIGFLFHNLPPAKTFMGDTGSIFLGTMIAIVTLFIGKETIPSKVVVALPLIAGVPMLEVFVTMVRRFCKTRDRKKSFAFCLHSMVIPDNSHIHHRLMHKGYSAAQSLTFMLILACSFSCGAVLSIGLPNLFIPLLLCYLLVPVYFTLYQLGFGGRFRKALHLSSTRYNGFQKQTLIGVIDTEGSLSQRLKKKNIKGVSYIKIAESDISSLYKHLRAAVLIKTDVYSEIAIQKAEEISYLMRGPVYIVDDTDTSALLVREISRNGTLSILERTASIEQLSRELKQLSTIERIRHSQTADNLLKQESQRERVC